MLAWPQSDAKNTCNTWKDVEGLSLFKMLFRCLANTQVFIARRRSKVRGSRLSLSWSPETVELYYLHYALSLPAVNTFQLPPSLAINNFGSNLLAAGHVEWTSPSPRPRFYFFWSWAFGGSCLLRCTGLLIAAVLEELCQRLKASAPGLFFLEMDVYVPPRGLFLFCDALRRGTFGINN